MATQKSELKAQRWYWISIPSEGDIFYPVFVVDNEKIKFDGVTRSLSEFEGASFDEAVLPTVSTGKSRH